jgi:threonine dehydrogenase-like Zn-dependent dehydrogenase
MPKRTVAAVTGKGEVTLLEEELPELKENQVLIKVHASLISPGTEVSSIKDLRITPDAKRETSPFGYANAGEVLEVKGDDNGINPGMRVAAMGAGYASHANYAIVPINLVVAIPDSVTYDQAAYACLGSTALHAINRTIPQLGEYGLILGQGIVGNLAAQLSLLSGARTIAWETMPKRIEIANECGIENVVNVREQDSVEATKQFSSPYGADFTIVAFGGEATDAFKLAMSCMKVSADGHAMGRIVLVGGAEVSLKGGASTGNLDIRSSARTGPGYHDPNYEHGKDYPDAFVQFTTQRNLKEIIRLIDEGRLKVDPMTTHTIKLSDAAKAVDLLIDHADQAMGVVLRMSH